MASRQVYRFGPFHLDPAGRILSRGGEDLPIPPKAADLLLLLVQNAGEVLEKQELMADLWPDSVVEDGSLTRAVFTVRKVLGDGQNGQEYVTTVPKRGYRFVAPVALVDKGSPGSTIPTSAPHARGWRVLLAAGLAVLVAVAAWEWKTAHHVPPQATRLIVAVLPMQNLTGDQRNEYVADGLTEELISQLSRYSPNRLGVIARSSAIAYRISGKTAQQIGRELGANYLVESSLRAEGDHLRIAAQIVRTRDQTYLWSSSYDRTMNTLFSLEDEVAPAIALHVGVELQQESRSRLAQSRPVNPDAYLAYLEGRYYWNRRSPDALELAITNFKKAVQLDSSYALAYGGLADAYASQCLIADVVPSEVLPKARAAALKAIEIDGGLAEAHTSLAYVKFWLDWDWNGAERELKRALDLNAGYATAHQWYAEFLRLMGREEEAIAESRKATELDPLSLIIRMESGLPYYFQRRFDVANQFYLKTLEMDPNFGLAHCVLGWFYLAQGAYPSAIVELEKAHQLDDSSAVLASLGRAYAEAGRKHDAETILAELRKRSRTRYVSPPCPHSSLLACTTISAHWMSWNLRTGSTIGCSPTLARVCCFRPCIGNLGIATCFNGWTYWFCAQLIPEAQIHISAPRPMVHVLQAIQLIEQILGTDNVPCASQDEHGIRLDIHRARFQMQSLADQGTSQFADSNVLFKLTFVEFNFGDPTPPCPEPWPEAGATLSHLATAYSLSSRAFAAVLLCCATLVQSIGSIGQT